MRFILFHIVSLQKVSRMFDIVFSRNNRFLDFQFIGLRWFRWFVCCFLILWSLDNLDLIFCLIGNFGRRSFWTLRYSLWFHNRLNIQFFFSVNFSRRWRLFNLRFSLSFRAIFDWNLLRSLLVIEMRNYINFWGFFSLYLWSFWHILVT